MGTQIKIVSRTNRRCVVHLFRPDDSVPVAEIEFTLHENVDWGEVLRFKGLLHYRGDAKHLSASLSLGAGIELLYQERQLLLQISTGEETMATRCELPLASETYAQIDSILDHLLSRGDSS